MNKKTKHFLFTLLSLMVASLTLCSSSCNKDDDEEEAVDLRNDYIQGWWTLKNLPEQYDGFIVVVNQYDLFTLTKFSDKGINDIANDPENAGKPRLQKGVYYKTSETIKFSKVIYNTVNSGWIKPLDEHKVLWKFRNMKTGTVEFGLAENETIQDKDIDWQPFARIVKIYPDYQPWPEGVVYGEMK
ncbi:MAG: hypothetical protein IKT00_10285 [Prevotella sp.]|nr:hypothetical protein [Prevotella sp.]